MELDEVKPVHYSHLAEPQISLTKCSFTWKKSYIQDLLDNKRIKDFLLNDITFDLKKGQMLGVIGKEGSGKTTLICSLMKENYLVNGKFTVEGKIAYVESVPGFLS